MGTGLERESGMFGTGSVSQQEPCDSINHRQKTSHKYRVPIPTGDAPIGEAQIITDDPFQKRIRGFGLYMKTGPIGELPSVCDIPQQLLLEDPLKALRGRLGY